MKIAVKDFKKQLKPKERSIYTALTEYLTLHPSKLIWRWDVGADVRLSIGQAKKLKVLNGAHRGYPDLLILEPMAKLVPSVRSDRPQHEWQTYHGLFIEVKPENTRLTNKSGKWATPHIQEQSNMHARLREKGYFATFACGLDECIKVIESYLK